MTKIAGPIPFPSPSDFKILEFYWHFSTKYPESFTLNIGYANQQKASIFLQNHCHKNMIQLSTLNHSLLTLINALIQKPLSHVANEFLGIQTVRPTNMMLLQISRKSYISTRNILHIKHKQGYEDTLPDFCPLLLP